MNHITVRAATIDDTQQIIDFILKLADYEKAQHEVVSSAEHIHNTLFCKQPKVHALICEKDSKPIGFAVFFFNYSTWLGKHGIYLEDLYVSQNSRGSGAGKALLKRLAEIAIANDCGRLVHSPDYIVEYSEFVCIHGEARLAVNGHSLHKRRNTAMGADKLTLRAPP